MTSKTVYAVVGPTASGKTVLSLTLAQRIGGEILCMDSMQVYRRMNIGTAKPTPAEQAAIPHHLLDLVEPDEAFTVSDYEAAARPMLDALPVPLLVGGTGLYLEALSTRSSFGTVAGDEALRQQLHRVAEREGVNALHARLAACDPVSAARIHPNDVRRVVRALEVYTLTGRPFSQLTVRQTDDRYRFCLIGIDLPREALYRRINARVEQMMAQGLLKEVRALRDSGVPEDAQAMQGLGYKELYAYLDGEMSLDAAVSLIQMRTRHYAKRQLTWFRRDDRIHWLSFTDDPEALAGQALHIIKQSEEHRHESV